MSGERVAKGENEEYGVGFWCHGEYHEMLIDLEYFAKAIAPYLMKLSKRGGE